MNTVTARAGAWAVAAALLAGCGAAGEATPLAAETACTPNTTPASWVAGSTALCQGHLVYLDYLYDDYGAGNGRPNMPLPGAVGTSSAGAAQYPAGAENTADLVRFELSLEGNTLALTYELNTLFEPGQTQALIAIDTDNNPATGNGELPGFGVRAPGWEVMAVFREGNPQSNLIQGRLPKPQGAVWRITIALAQADGTVMNVGFRGTDELARSQLSADSLSGGRGSFFEDRQAEALRQGDLTPFAATVAVADLERGITRPAAAPRSGFFERVYTAAFTVPRTPEATSGEGISPEGVPGRGDGGDVDFLAQDFVFLGRYQPYAVYLPTTATAPMPLQLVFHGSGAAHTSQINSANFQQAFGEAYGRLLVSPLGRGPRGFGSDFAERDSLDVLADVQRHYPVDAERIIASGYSQGGYITLRMTALYPHLFAGFVQWVGVTGNRLRGTPLGNVVSVNAGAVGDMIDYIGNLRHIPGAMLHGAADYLAPLPATAATRAAFAASDNVYEWFLHPAGEHLFFMLFDDWRKEALYSANFRRVQNPARVSYRTDPVLGNAALGIVHNRAYWLSGITTREPGPGTVDLTNHACGGSLPQGRTGSRAGLDPVPWVSTFRVAEAPLPLAAQPLIEGTLSNMAQVQLDAEQTCILNAPLRYAITSDGPAVLLLSDGRRLVLVAGLNEGQL